MAVSRIGTIGRDTFEAGLEAEAFDGAYEYDTVSYLGAAQGLTLDRADGARSTGAAAGDTFTSIERYFLTTFDDVFYGSEGNDAVNSGTGNDTLWGGDGNDTLSGHAGDDVLYGENGNDGFYAGTGNDWISGGAGNDVAFGEAGDDMMFGDDGDDTLHGGAGNDVLNGGAGSNTLNGDAGDDEFHVELSVGNDSLNGGLGHDTLVLKLPSRNVADAVIDDLKSMRAALDSEFADAGGDAAALAARATPDRMSFAALGLSISAIENVVIEVEGERAKLADFLDDLGPENLTLVDVAGNQTLTGGDGDDTIIAAAGRDVYDGGAGFDTLDMSTAARAVVDLAATKASGHGRDVVQNIEAVIGSAGNDVLRGDTAANTLAGGNGADLLEGRTGDDTLDGGSGDDRLNGGDGNDTIVDGAGNDRVNGNNGDDVIISGAGNDRINGNNGDDVIVDGEGNDIVNGNDGNDTIVTGAGNDTYNGGKGFDTIDFSAVSQSLVINLGARTAIGDGNDRITGFEKVIGSDFADAISGSNNAEHLIGGAGDDVIRSLRGLDVLTGGEGADTFVFAKSDVVSGSRNLGTDVITDYSTGDVLDFSGFFRNGVDTSDVVRLTQTDTGTMVEAQIGQRGAFVNVVLLEDAWGLDVAQMTSDGSLLV